MKVIFKKTFVIFISLSAGIALSSCGKSDDEESAPPAPTAPQNPGGNGSGSGSGTGSDPSSGSATYAPCPYGSSRINVNGSWIYRCDRIVIPYYSVFGGIGWDPRGDFPRLTAFGQMEGIPLHAPVPVYAGDKIVFSGAGSYGKDKEGFFWSCNSSDVDDIDLLGYWGSTRHFYPSASSSGVDPVPAGLIANAGSVTYLLGFNSQQLVLEDGVLMSGFNSDHKDACYTLTVTQYKIKHCTDSAGYTISCP